MTDWKNSLIPPDATIGDAVATINDGGFEIAVVAEGEETLVGTITDGDIRRALLAGLGLDAPAAEIMNREPETKSPDADPAELLQWMKDKKFRQVPLLNGDARLVGLRHIRDLTEPIEIREHWVVLMAGGLGERLRPLTEERPKPLLSVGDKPILEATLERFIEQKFRRFYISVNYKAIAIKDHFGDGGKWGVEIRYLEEDRRLGTAGALRLLPEPPENPLVVMNGDLITRINFQDLLDYHDQQNAKATMCVRQYDLQVPFGVIDIVGNRVRAIDEKPIHRFLVNAGIYVVEPELIGLIPADTLFDMTDLFGATVAAEEVTVAFPIHEYWLDIGRMDDLDRANREFGKNFRR